MAFDKPQSRNEAILQNMLGANNELEPPKSRVEALLQELSGKMPEANPSEGTTTGTLERLKIGDDIYTVEGGGSGTSDYDALNNKPQIAGTTLSGNKSLADLGIASASAVSDILNGTDIDSFGDVETALAGKQGTLTFDSAPTSESTNPVTSGGVYTALAGKVDKTSVGVASGVAELDSNGKVPSAQLPSYVDDVVNGYLHDGKFYADDQYTTEITGEEGKIYVDLATNKTYRWSGLAFVEISESLALGETSSTAYAGDKGKANADAISAIKDGQTIDSFADVESALAGKQDTLTFDNTPTENSTNPVKSGGIYSALAGKADTGIVADDFDSTASYVIGNYCIENGKLYRFKANHSGTWSSADVDEIQITGELATLKSGFTTLDNEVNGDATVYPYADVITIPDSIPSNLANCNVKIEPVQDLHGYDKPWVGGAWKNKCKSRSASATSNGVEFTLNDDGTVTANRTSTSENNAYVVLPSVTLPAGTYKFSGCNGGFDTGYWIDFSYNSTSHRQYTEELTATFTEETTVTPWLNVYVSYNAQNKVFSPMIRIDGTTSTYEPYENICPITGHTEARVQRDGVNLLNSTKFARKNPDSGDASNNWAIWEDYIRCNYNNSLTLNCGIGHVQIYRIIVNCFDKYMNHLGNISETYIYGDGYTFTINIAGTKYCRVQLYNATSMADYDFSTAQLEYGSTATPYVPYAGKTYTIALGDTIYGGTVNFDSGVMTVDRAIDTVGNLSFTKYDVAQGTLFRAGVSGIKNIQSYDVTTLLCSAYASSSSNDRVNGTISQIGNSESIDIIDNRYSDAGDFKTAMGSTQICYELATHTTIQLTPQQIQLLKGQNTLTASTGQISVTVNGVSGAIGQVQEQVNDTDEALAELVADIAEQLPTAPTTDGTYVLTVTVADGTPTYSWESAT